MSGADRLLPSCQAMIGSQTSIGTPSGPGTLVDRKGNAKAEPDRQIS